MNCEAACGVAALAASGDATAAEMHDLERHIAECAECQAEVAAFAVLRGQLGGMRENSLPDSAFAAVRARVVSEIDGGRRRRWVLGWSSLAVATACLMIVASALHRGEPLAEIRPPAAPGVIATVQENEPRVSELPAPRRFVRRAVRRIPTRELTEPIVVHIFTSDPDVVIYWIADAKIQSSNKEIMQ